MENFNNTTNVSDAGFNDILVGTELYRNLQLSPADLDDNITFSKIRDIADTISIDNINKIYIDADVNGEGVTYLYLN